MPEVTVIEVCVVFLTMWAMALTAAAWEALSALTKLTRHRLAREMESEAREQEERRAKC